METLYGSHKFFDSFYEWKKNVSPENVLTSSSSCSVNKHAWTALDRSRVETPSTFPPYRGIIIVENHNAAKAIPLVQKDDNALGIDGRIQKPVNKSTGLI